MTVLTEREIRLLEFDQIRTMLASHTVTAIGKEEAQQLLPVSDVHEIGEKYRETTEACALLVKGFLTIQPVPDIRLIIKKTEKGGILSTPELSKVKDFIQACRHVQGHLKKEPIREISPAIASFSSRFNGCPVLLQKLKSCIGDDGDIHDKASPLLNKIRRTRITLSQRIQDRLEEYIRSPGWRRYLQEPLITIRNDRYVVPVKQEYRAQLQGIFHDQSSSGATLYIEPISVVEAQNKLQQYKNMEKKEIDRILTELSALIKSNAGLLRNDITIYGHLDFIMAKGRLSFSMEGIEPRITAEQFIDLNGSRHPLLKEDAVPINFKLGGYNRIMVVTGPNTGGKTVTLKTVGLLVAMAQCGLHLPVRAGTKIGIFREIRVDIGDEQSLEQSLSTFSAHLKNIISILGEAGPQSLVLLDELGAGTDPSEGAALARAILTNFYRKGSLVVTTTHINDLKMFAHVQEGVQNASLEFDVETLSPTYRLIMGIPGSSNALIIAAKLGMSADIIDEARSYFSREHEEIETIINGLNIEQKRFKEETEQVVNERMQAESLRQQLEEEMEKMKVAREETLGKARTEAIKIIKEAKQKANQSINDLRRIVSGSRKRKEELPSLKEAEEIRRSLNDIMESVYDTGTDPDNDIVSKDNIRCGDKVYIKSLKQEGIIEYIDLQKDSLRIQVQDKNIETNLKDISLRQANPQKNKQKTRIPVSYMLNKGYESVSDRIDLHGFTLEEAKEKLERYLDNAVLSNYNHVYVIHGRGTGRLRKGLQAFLKEHHHVHSFRDGYPEEGDIGVTVVTLK